MAWRRKTRTEKHDTIAPVVGRNIRALLERKHQEESRKRWSERLADRVTRFAGSMTSVYVHALVYGGWIYVNSIGVPYVRQFDPTLVILAVAASVEAIFLSTFMLVSQNRLRVLTEKMADLDLQVSLLTEHEVTRLIGLVTKIAQRLDVAEGHDPELETLAREVTPEHVLDTIDAHETEFNRTAAATPAQDAQQAH